MAKYANRKRIDHSFKVGDRVLLPTKNLKLESGSNTRKLHPKYCGPFKILRQISPFKFKIDLSHPLLAKGVHDTFHANLHQPSKSDRYRRESIHNLQ